MRLRPRSRLGLFRLGTLVVLVLVSAPSLAHHAVGGETVAVAAGGEAAAREPPSGVTVFTIDGNGPGQLTAIHPNGSVLYRNRSHSVYHDVDPSPKGDHTVMYVAADLLPASACDGPTTCIRNVIERVNLTTGTVTRLYTRVGPRIGSSQIHDVDRVNDSVLLIGDIGPPDRVYMVDTTADAVIWEWRVRRAYDPESGGVYPGDWTHLNDVEYLQDGRVVVNLRNQDQVVFVRPGRGLVADWALGCDDCHRTLYEHHNPDYLPAERGGPALLIADSENNRVVEYQRVDGAWRRSWAWSDARLQWPRDADRLPGGSTLIADSHGSRILEVDRGGAITWQRDVPDGVYDVERLGTGDESTGGASASVLAATRSRVETKNVLVRLVPPLVLHGTLYVLPGWTSATDAAALLIGGVIGTVWASVEGAVVARRRVAWRWRGRHP